MTVDRVELKIVNERHHLYRDVFHISNKREYFNRICKFLEDETLSHIYSDDLELFSDLMFQSKFGRVHMEFGTFLCDRILDNDVNGKLVNKFIDYISYLSSAHVEDFYHNVLKDFGLDFVPMFLKHLKVDYRLKLAQIASVSFPQIYRAVPKLKTYLLFS